MKWFCRRRKVVGIPPMPDREVLEALNINLEHPVLRAILCLLKGMEDIANETSRALNQTNESRAWYSGASAAHADAQDAILEKMEAAHRAANVTNRRRTRQPKAS